MTEPVPAIWPAISDEMRAHAKVQPDSWLYVLDPAADPDLAVPPELVIGAYPVDERGELVEAFEPNPGYVAAAVPAHTDPLDAALQELSTGRGSREAVLALLRTADMLMLPGAADGDLVVHPSPHGRDVVHAFTSAGHAQAAAGPSDWQRRRGRELARSLPPGVDLRLNPGSAAAVTVPRESLLR